MYGTVAPMQANPGTHDQLAEAMNQFQAHPPAGYKSTYILKMDDDPNTYFLAVVFEGKEAYVANASSAEYDAMYQHLLRLLQWPPEWHDGEVVFPQS